MLRKCILLYHQVIIPLLPLIIFPSIKLSFTSTSYLLSYHLIPPPRLLTQIHHILSPCIPLCLSVTYLLPFLPPIWLSMHYYLLPLSSFSCFFAIFFFFLSFCSPSLSLPFSLFAPSVFIPQGVLSQSEANLPNYKPHLLSLSLTLSLIHTLTHIYWVLLHPAPPHIHISSLSHTYTEA